MITRPYFMEDRKFYRYEEGAEEKYGTNYLLTEEGWNDPKAVESFKALLCDDEPYEGYGEEMFEKMEAERLYGRV